MDLLKVIESIILGIILGITEFLPVSSLGHSLVLASLLKFPPTKETRDTFAIFIQLGAVLAVLVYHGPDLIKQAQQLSSNPKTRQLWLNVLIAFLPIGIIGFIFRKPIKLYLFSPLIVGIALVLGGIVLLLFGRGNRQPTAKSLEQITPVQALTVGLAQITALIPGVSRSGATIIGGLLCGLEQTVATDFTFYLFIPTLGAAAGYELLSAFRDRLVDTTLMPYFLLATVTGFIASLLVMRWLLRYIATHDFRIFGVYRILIGVILIALVFITHLA